MAMERRPPTRVATYMTVNRRGGLLGTQLLGETNPPNLCRACRGFAGDMDSNFGGQEALIVTALVRELLPTSLHLLRYAGHDE